MDTQQKSVAHSRKTKKSVSDESLIQVLSDYCKNTSAHGFQYWISSSSGLERLLWIAIVIAGFTSASVMVSSAIQHWIEFPTTVAIKTFSLPANDVPYPAITICNQNGYDVGEYLRAVFDNFQYKCDCNECKETELLRSHFPAFSSASSLQVYSQYNHV